MESGSEAYSINIFFNIILVFMVLWLDCGTPYNLWFMNDTYSKKLYSYVNNNI